MSLEKTEQAKQLLKVFGNDNESPYFLMAAGTAEECERMLSELINPDDLAA